MQRHTQLLVTGKTEVLYDGCHCHLPPPAKAARGRGRGRVVLDTPTPVRPLETREVACARAASSGATTGGNSCGVATRAASSGVATGPPVPAADDIAGPPSTDAAVRTADERHSHGEAAEKRKALFMRSARMKAPTTAALMGSPVEEEEFDEPRPAKRARPAAAAAAAAVQLFPEPAVSPHAGLGESPPVAAGLSPRPTSRRGAATGTMLPPVRPVAHQNAAVAHQGLPVDAQNLSRCPLYFLACVAAKEKFTSV